MNSGRPVEAAPCPAGCKPIWCWCSRDSVMDGNTAQPPLSTERGGSAGVGIRLVFFVVLVQGAGRCIWAKIKGGKREKRGWKRWYDSDTPGVDVPQWGVCSSAVFVGNSDLTLSSALTLELTVSPCSSPLTSLTGRSYLINPFFLSLKQCERRCRVCVCVCARSRIWKDETEEMEISYSMDEISDEGTNAAQLWLKVCGFRGSHITYVTMQLKSFK